MTELPKLPEVYDFSNGSDNPYLVEARHQLIPPCVHCHRFVPVKLDGGDYYRFFVAGTAGHVQQAFPYLNAGQREVLINGIHPECWDAFMGPEPEDDEDGES